MKEKDLAVYVGNKIREFRKKKKLTQKELGDIIGVKHNTISNYETGTISPEQDALFLLSRALDISIDDLFPHSDEDNDLEKALSLSDDMDLNDMDFLNKLIKQTKSLKGEERKKFIDNIRFAVEYFDRTNK
ncbi:helix-turn-helix domain-containing protein [Virgibacillus salexigens]|uniref:helix-turn-helix domain-containing protein n=1 Tax=Virgibacillus salexigens TaxID=61016 RepID=UPI00190E177F|nr:helix-turn-helix domain-containing protein [Virgibacillus salexigens]